MHPKQKRRRRPWLAEEQGTIRKNWAGKFRIALAFPNHYSVGMSNLGFQYVYGALNSLDDVVCERVFYPEGEELAQLQERAGTLLSVESERPVRDFDLLAFSIPYENDYSHAVEMLAMAGIPPLAENRGSEHPLVAAGGVAVFLNPEPLSPFLDFLFIGEAEAILPDFLDVWRDFSERSRDRRELLKALAKNAAGIYVPSLYRVSYLPDGTLEAVEPIAGCDVPAKVAYRRADLSTGPVCRTVIFTPNTEFANVSLMEIGRGCGRGCRFCAAGYVYRPLRYHRADKLIEAAEENLPEVPRIGLVSAAVSDHPEISFLCSSLLESGGALSFSSLRADTLTPELVSALQASGHKAVAIAPEAGSDRLRRVINKNITEEEVYSAVELLTQAGILHIKLYFMIGLPTETIDDLNGIVDLVKGVKHNVLKISRGRKQIGTITLSIHSYIPKPFTPFQWVPFAGVKELKERAKWIQRALQKVPNVRVHFDMPKWAYVQALLARGDRRAAMFLEKVAVGGLSWSQAMRDLPFNPDFWVMRERGQDELFPWEVIDHGVRRTYLWEEYQRGLKGEKSGPCMPDENCRRCGACEP